jgi:hypothetical protein
LHEKRGTDGPRQIELLDEVKLELHRVGLAEAEMVELWKDRKSYEKVVADIYCNAVISGWGSGNWWGLDQGRVRNGKEREFLKRNGGLNVEMTGLGEVRTRLRNSQDNNEQKNAPDEISARAATSLKQFELRGARRLENDIRETLRNNAADARPADQIAETDFYQKKREAEMPL